MPKRKFFVTSEGSPHSYGSLLTFVGRLGPSTRLSTVNATPTIVPRPTKTRTGR